MASKKKTAAGFELLIAELKKNPKAEYAALKAKAEKKRVTIYPVMFGRAKAMLGLVKSKPRGQGKSAKRKVGTRRGPGRPPKSRGPGRPRKTASANGVAAAVQDLVRTMRDHERENAALRATLERVRDLIDRAL
ncbi:MAG: hypothetical protein AAF628_35255 [Planctomycetota bacterium]